MRIISITEKEFSRTPRNGWVGDEFFLLSAGGKIKRVWNRNDPGLPRFATEAGREGIVAENQAITAWCNAKSVEAALDAAHAIVAIITEDSRNWVYLVKAQQYIAIAKESMK